MSDDHLTTEEISALLDRGADPAGRSDHLEECPVCRREMELLRRMRMALSALDDRDAPRGAWASIEAGLEERDAVEPADGTGGDGPDGERAFALADVGWLRAAAAVLLFAGGLGLGTVLTSSGAVDPAGGREVASTERGPAGGSASGADASASGLDAGDRPTRGGRDAAPETGGEVGSTVPSAGEAAGTGPAAAGPPAVAAADGGRSAGVDGELTYREAVDRLEALRARGPTLREAYRNPQAAAEQLARLDALMRASREALREDPADPALNDFLFQVAQEKAALNRALELSSLEYR